MNRTPWNDDERPAWLDDLPEEAPQTTPVPYDGFGKGYRRVPVMSSRGVNDQGKARHWQLHPALLTATRLMLITHISMRGPCTTVELSEACGISLRKIGMKLRRLEFMALIDSRQVPGRRNPNGGPGHVAREWSITENGRRALWRVGWVSRDVLHAPWDDVPLRDDVESDPVQAIRRHVVNSWLRPLGLQCARILIAPGWSPISIHQMSRLGEMHQGQVWRIVQQLRRRGWVTADPDSFAYDSSGIPYPKWKMNADGKEALGRHVDALRRAGRTTGWTLEPDNSAYQMTDEHGEFYICWEPEAARLGWKL